MNWQTKILKFLIGGIVLLAGLMVLGSVLQKENFDPLKPLKFFINKPAQAQTPEYQVEVLGPNGQPTDFQPAVVQGGSGYRIQFPEQRHFQPGQYQVKLSVVKDGVVYISQTQFLWGVLAINFNKSIYNLQDLAKIGLAVLDNRGKTICDAEIEMTIISPSGKVAKLTTQNKKITRSPDCGPNTVTIEPDYAVYYAIQEIGNYQVKVTAQTSAGERRLTDSFQVVSPPLFDVERIGPTRIYPPENYRMTFKIKPAQDFTGQIQEFVPDSFAISNISAPNGSEALQTNGARLISWSANWQAGQTYELFYEFKAPDISPELYKLGPLKIGLWQESRQWQIAADAADEVILLWDDTTAGVPVGWTCISCAGTDPFYGVFPRASTTYGSASTSQNTHTHTVTNSTTSQASAAIQRNTGTSNNSNPQSHTHTVSNFTSNAGDHQPLFKNLLFIKAATTSLPAGIIGIFDVAATSALPVNWDYFSNLENNYLRGGENTTSTGGAAEHNNAVSATSLASSQTQQGAGTTGPANFSDSAHTHSISGNLNPASNTPPFIKVVFAKLNTAASIPDGLIAIFDVTPLPTNWNQITSSSFMGNFLVGSNSAGSTGGSTTHSHSTTTITSGAASAAVKISTAGSFNFTDKDATHNFSLVTDSQTSLPIYRDVILGKFTAPPNQAPAVSAVVLNNSNEMILTPSTTTSFNINFTVTDNDGCSDVFTSGNVTTTVYRSGVGASCSAENLNCYITATTTNNCVGGNSANATATVNIWYFAQATDASSSFPAQNWLATVAVRDSAANTDSSTTVTGVELRTLVAVSVATSTIQYGSLAVGANTGATNQSATSSNAGNSSTTLKMNCTAMSFSSNNNATSNQHYATSTFTYGGSEQACQTDPTDVNGTLMTAPTSTTGVLRSMFWGVAIDGGLPAGTYSGTDTYGGAWAP